MLIIVTYDINTVIKNVTEIELNTNSSAKDIEKAKNAPKMLSPNNYGNIVFRAFHLINLFISIYY